jgi:hypothetical protein
MVVYLLRRNETGPAGRHEIFEKGARGRRGGGFSPFSALSPEHPRSRESFGEIGIGLRDLLLQPLPGPAAPPFWARRQLAG